MKNALLILAVIFGLAGACMADGGTYESRLAGLVGEAGKIYDSSKSGSLDHDKFNAWYKVFKGLQSQFKSDFAASHGRDQAYKLAEEGFAKIEEASGNFDMARQSWESYKNMRHVLSISSPRIRETQYADVSEVKMDAENYRRKANKCIAAANEAFVKAKSALAEQK